MSTGLTDREWQILYACYKYYYLTSKQLTRLYYGNSLSLVRGRCRALEQQKYLQEIQIGNLGRGGTSPLFWTLAFKGWQEIERRGYERRRYRRNEESVQDRRNMRHTQAVNEHFIAAELLHRSDLPATLEGIYHERDFRRSKHVIEPDGWLDFRVTDAEGVHQQAVLLELDQDTQREPIIRGKVERYLSYLPGDYVREFETEVGVVLFATTKGDKRAKELLRWIEKYTTPDTAGWFLVTAELPQAYREHYFFEQHCLQPHRQERTSILV